MIEKRMLQILKRFRYHIIVFFSVIGPGFITAVVDNDAGGIYTYSQAGARWGYLPLWTLIPIAVLLVGDDHGPTSVPGTHDYHIGEEPAEFSIAIGRHRRVCCRRCERDRAAVLRQAGNGGDRYCRPHRSLG